MATSAFPPFSTQPLPPFTPPVVWVSFFATYSLRALLLGFSMMRYSHPHAVRVLWCTLVPPQRPLLDYLISAVLQLQHATGKAILKRFQGDKTKEGERGLILQR